MALLIADTTGKLEDVEHFTRSMSGAEVNVAIGLSRLGHEVEYITKLGDDPFGHYIENKLKLNGIGTSFVMYDDVYKTGIQLKNRVTDGSDPYAPYYRKGSAASPRRKRKAHHQPGAPLQRREGFPNRNPEGKYAGCGHREPAKAHRA